MRNRNVFATVVLTLFAAAAAFAADPRRHPVVVDHGELNKGIATDSSFEMQNSRAELQKEWEADYAAMLRGEFKPASPGLRLQALSGGGNWVCLPTCTPNDGRMFVIAGAGAYSLPEDTLAFRIGSPSSAANLEFGFFDGDTGGQWDQGTTSLTYELFADPTANGSGTISLGSWNGVIMPDNGWFAVSIPNAAQARAANGNYFYRLVVTNPNFTVFALPAFKIRAKGWLAVPPAEEFAYFAAMGRADRPIIYTNYPALTPTTYDGAWVFHVDIVAPIKAFESWDGDLDFGDYRCIAKDTNDPATPNSVPLWEAGLEAVPEGIALGYNYGFGQSTGSPADDNGDLLFLRTPNVWFQTITPNGITVNDTDPSGNREWEYNKVVAARGKTLPAGMYHVHLYGMDVANLNAWRFEQGWVTACSDTQDDCPVQEKPCVGTGTLGYWKNHASAWPEPTITVGNLTYTVSQAIAKMNIPGSGDKTYDLFRQLVAAMLNVGIGNEFACIADTIAAANTWLGAHPLGSGVSASSSAWATAAPMHKLLDDYNNGRLCAPHRDDLRCDCNE